MSAWDVFATEEVNVLRAQVADLLPWAQIAAAMCKPDGMIAPGLGYRAAQELIERIMAGEFGEPL